jgi:hypothetical protein
LQHLRTLFPRCSTHLGEGYGLVGHGGRDSGIWIFNLVIYYTFKWLAYRTNGSHLWVRGYYTASGKWGVDPETYCTAVQVVHNGNIRSTIKGLNIRIWPFIECSNVQ